MLDYDVAIIGGGPGGIAAAIRLAEMGLKKIVLIERDNF
ncbi:MAG TPA: FAD-dependent oxidoreductase, partial [Candidatus Lokiarchaeia archaeon]